MPLSLSKWRIEGPRCRAGPSIRVFDFAQPLLRTNGVWVYPLTTKVGPLRCERRVIDADIECERYFRQYGTMRTALALTSLALLSCCSDKMTLDQREQEMKGRVQQAEQLCGLEPKSIRFFQQGNYIAADGGCPPNPVHACLWDYKTRNNLSDSELSIWLPFGCGGVE